MPDIAIRLCGALASVEALAGEVYPASLKEHKKTPYCMYLQRSGEERSALSGWLGDRTDAFEVNILSTAYSEARSIAASCETALKALEGTEAEGIRVEAVFIDQNSPELWEDLPKLFRKIINVKFFYTGGN